MNMPEFVSRQYRAAMNFPGTTTLEATQWQI